ncbi:hypothetical protein G7054_g14901 [Neopestalotiopsis clavispora]|nr:hypothetical protein G7054_g14901 [Neopestalotiopsis clavispora]
MSPSAEGSAAPSGAVDNYPSTLPGPNHNWKITLEGKVIAITGANQGIGLGLAQVCLANDAAKVFSLDIQQPGEDFAALAKLHPGKLEFVQTDITNEESVKSAIDEVATRGGRFDGLIANAGATKHLPALDFTLEQFERLYKLT